MTFFVLGFMVSSAQCLFKSKFNEDWKFSLNGAPERNVNLPHDWAIEGDFSKDNPSGTGGGALPGGMGIYTKTLTLTDDSRKHHFRLDFDGVYMDAEVIVNGHSFGRRPYGYISFGYDITPYLNFKKRNADGTGYDNEIIVRVDNTEQPNSRWYSGCGIYRNVWLTEEGEVHIANNGTYVTATPNDDGSATVVVRTTVRNDSRKKQMVTVGQTIYNKEGVPVAGNSGNRQVLTIASGSEREFSDTLIIDKAMRWDVFNPYRYVLISTPLCDNLKFKGEVDPHLFPSYMTIFGVRSFEFNADNGFILNGRKITINGVCNHHDLGCLGAAVNKHALRRQLEILKDMGCNGIRCSHNPPSPELLDLCDEMGFIVMDESFDMWRKKKTAHDYARYFNEWHERDLHDFIVRDRNHPSVFIWSIGNEVLEQWSDANADTLSLEEANMILNFGHSAEMLAKDGEMSVNSLLCRKLTDYTHSLDPTRPVTAGCNEPDPGNHLFRSGALDIIGFNYHNQNIPDVKTNFPGKPFIITESNSALMTRGYYRMPSDSMFIWPVRWDIPFFDESFACSSYENCHVPWGNTHEENLVMIKKNPWIAGQYIWTGFDYIGEPTPYGWPARSSYFGIIDLAGFPKDVYYLYKSEWTKTPTLHLFPHWNAMPDGDAANTERDLWCYYNDADEVELFVNGVSQGTKAKTDDTLHVVWRVKYEPGEVKVVAKKNGTVVREESIRTAGAPALIRLTPDRKVIDADGNDLSFVTVEVVDEDGNLCPLADNEITFNVSGSAFIAGVDNGSPTSLERFKPVIGHEDTASRKAFYGKCLVVIQNNGNAGTATLTATAPGLVKAVTKITQKALDYSNIIPES